MYQLTFVPFLFFVSNTQAASFKTLIHGVEGDVKFEGNSLVVDNFSYDGEAPDAFFYVGTQGCPSGLGTLLGELLGAQSRQRVKLDLPDNIRAGDVTWVSVWCRKFAVDFGHAFLSDRVEENCNNGSLGSG